MTAADGFAARLLRWFDHERRDLPWRRTRDPWAIWVSEIMLQQTRVEAVREPFERFVNAYPTPAAFAAASDDELLRAWRGLGYYRRARLLREAARRVADEYGGRVPDRVDELGRLPGVGEYTRGAVASIAFGRAEVAVDGNVERVVARHRGITTPIDNAGARRAIREVAARWLDRERPGDFNQGLMELGATICTPLNPACVRCPVAADCVARSEDSAGRLPVRRPPPAIVAVDARVVLVTRRGEALGYRIPAGQPNAGQVELPGPGILVSIDPDDLAAALRRRFGARVSPGPVAATVRHAITNHRITLHVHAGTLRAAGRLEWQAMAAATPWTTPSRKAFRQAVGANADLGA